MKKERGITLVALVITVIIILILAGVALSLITGEEGLFARTNHAASLYKDASQTEADKVGQLINSEYMGGKGSGTAPEPDIPEPNITTTFIPETNINPSIYNEGKGVKVEITDSTNSGYQLQYSTNGGGSWNDYISGETEIYVAEYNGEVLAQLYDKETSTAKANTTINVTNIDTLEPEEFSYTEGEKTENTITISGNTKDRINKDISASSSVLKYKYAIQSTQTEPEWESIEATTETEKTFDKVTGTEESLQAGTTYYVYMLAVDEAENITKAGNNGTEIKTLKFTKANGVIDIVWLNTDNTVRTDAEGPLSPKDHLGGLTAVKYSGGAWESANVDNTSNEWYEYVAQAGNTEAGGTSHWANAKVEKDGKTAYFVWIPRYAYKITYFDTPEQAEAYRKNGSKEGIVGYSTIKGIIDVTSGEEKVVDGTEPTNVTGTVKTSEYTEYIPHPAFEFDGARAGIWVGKYESSGSITEVEIKENTPSLRKVSVDAMFTESKTMKDTYGLSGDTHMIKNIEWGAIAYLTESKYGRNGTEITTNTDENYTTGGGDYIANKLQSSTGNEYGIYDLSGGAYEYVAGYIENETVKSSEYNTSLVEEVDFKYKDVYKLGTTDSSENNYQANKGIKGDAVYETSTAGTGSTSWHEDYSYFPRASSAVFRRGGDYNSPDKSTGVFYFSALLGDAYSDRTLRVVLVPLV